MNEQETRRKRLSFGPVTPDRIDEVCARIKLTDPIRKRSLEVSLKHIEANLDDYVRSTYVPSKRRELIKQRQELLSAIDIFLKVIDRKSYTLQDLLPKESLELIGVMIATQPLREILGEQTPRYLTDNYNSSEHAAVGVEYGHIILPAVLRAISKPLSDWIDRHVDSGGRPPDLRRRYIIECLAATAKSIIGEDPTSTAGSPFMQLCIAIFQEFGLPDNGIEDAIERELRHLSA